MEYLILNSELKIVEFSPTIVRFADSPQHVLPGQDVRSGFPEITGSEEVLHQVYRGQVSSFKIEGIERSSQSDSPLYISLYILEYKEGFPANKRLLLLVEN
ncbi:MAG: adenylate/guanylate cyclase, partial [Desertifilum sp. SIO1I2]|nr:adenylate/guanylate cyclase [Desertifilum sp. SIO1I2]